MHKNGELAKEASKLSMTDETINGILANIEVTIENIYVRFEEVDLKFSIGLLIPKIEGYSVDETWNKLE